MTNPTKVLFHVSDGDVENRSAAATPFMIIGIVRASASDEADIPFIKSRFVLTNGEGFGNGNLVGGIFVLVAAVGPHDEGARWDDHQFRTPLAVLEGSAGFVLLRSNL